MTITDYARLRGVKVGTVHAAMKRGDIIQYFDGRIDSEKVDAGWYEEHLALKEQELGFAKTRQQKLTAGIVETHAAISAHTRARMELRRTTAPAKTARPAAEHRAERMLAALDALPGLAAPVAAALLGKSPRKAKAMVTAYAQQLAADIREIASLPE